MFIDESIKFAIKEYLYRENITKKDLAENLDVHEILIDKWMDGVVDFISTDLWLKLYDNIKLFLKNPELHKETQFKLFNSKLNDSRNDIIHTRISEMEYSELCERLSESLKYISQKYTINMNYLSFSCDVYCKILYGEILPTDNEIKELCRAFNLSKNTSELLVNLTDLIFEKEALKLSNIVKETSDLDMVDY